MKNVFHSDAVTIKIESFLRLIKYFKIPMSQKQRTTLKHTHTYTIPTTTATTPHTETHATDRKHTHSTRTQERMQHHCTETGINASSLQEEPTIPGC